MSHQQMPMIITEVGRKVEFRVTKARVSFPRRESYGLEARFKVNQHLCVFVFSVCAFDMVWLFFRCGLRAESWRCCADPPSTALSPGES